MTKPSSRPALRRVRSIALVAFSLMSNLTFAAENRSIMSLRTLYKVAVTERGDAVNAAMAKADEILERQPNDTVALVYKGSLLTMMGGDAFMPWNKLRYVQGGIDLMDNALGTIQRFRSHGADAGVEALMVAAFTNSRLPRMFKRDALARQQIAELIVHPAFGTLEYELRVQALEIAAEYARSDGDASRAAELLTRAAGLRQVASERKLQ